MHEDDYALGVDIGVGGVSVVACSTGTTGPVLAQVQLSPGTAARTVRVLARVGSPVPLYEGDRGRSAADVAADVVADARAAAEARLGRAPAWTVVAVPPSWGAYRTDLLTESLAATGAGASLVSGALAAVYAHIDGGRLPGAVTVAVYDLGAATLDTAVVRATPGGELEHLAPAPEPLRWGGQDVDDALLAHVLQSMSGAVPVDWECVRALRADVVAAKEALSSDTVTSVAAAPEEELRLTREELDELIGPGARESVHALAAAVAAAGQTLDDLDAVVLAGGSVRVPLVGELLSAELGRPLVVDAEPELTVARGAARLALALAAGATVPEAAPADDASTTPDAAGDAHPVPPVPPPAAARETPPRLVTRPPTSSARTRPAGRPAGRPGPRRVARVLVVAGLFLGLVLLVPTLSATLLPGAEPVAGTQAAADQDATAREAAPGASPGRVTDAAPRAGTGVEVREAAGQRAAEPDRATRRSNSVARVATVARAAAQRVTRASGTDAAAPGAGSPAAPRAAVSAATPSTAAASSSAAPRSEVAPSRTPSAPPTETRAPATDPAPTTTPPAGTPVPTTPPPPATGTPAADPPPADASPTTPPPATGPAPSSEPAPDVESPAPTTEPPAPGGESPAAATETPAGTTAAPVVP